MEPKVKFWIEAEIPIRWVPHFLGMLKAMEHYGNIGSSRYVGIYSDGDGDFHPRFKWSDLLETAKPKKNVNGDLTFDAG